MTKRKKVLITLSIFSGLLLLFNLVPKKPKLDIHKLEEVYPVLELTSQDLYNHAIQPLILRLEYDDIITQIKNNSQGETYVLISDKAASGDLGLKRDTLSLLNKYDENDQLVWSTGGIEGISYSDYFLYFGDIIELGNGDIIGIGKAYHTINPELSDLVLVRFNPLTGEILSVNLFNDMNIPRTELNYSLTISSIKTIKTSDQGFTILSSIYNYDTQSQSYLMTHFIGDELQSFHMIASPHIDWKFNVSFEGMSFEGFVVDQNGDYYMHSDEMIIKLSPSGDIIWEKEYDFDISTIYISNQNDLIIVGSQFLPSIKLLDENSFLKLDSISCDNNWIDCDINGNPGIIVSETVSGERNWMDSLFFTNKNIRYLSIEEDDENNLYIFTSHNENILYNSTSHNGLVIKYNQSGKRLGEFLTNDLESEERINHNINRLQMNLNENKLKFYDFAEGSYKQVNLDDVDWYKQKTYDYNTYMAYNNYITIRVWINRIVFIGLPVGFIITLYLVGLFKAPTKEDDWNYDNK
jgi:hypothetical protein